jgi:PetM family of cytochrome b6f complex subunit 7
MSELINTMVLSIVLTLVGISFGYLLLKFQGEGKSE